MFTYSVKFVCGQSLPAPTQSCTPVQHGMYSTEINIHNYHPEPAKVEKRLLLLVHNDAPHGREPEMVAAQPLENIILRPDSATMDDCCRFANSPFKFNPAQLNIGFLEIRSNIQLNVTAVYTATDPRGTCISIDVQTVNERQI